MTKEKIIELLKSTNREGMPQLIASLESWKFFESPASTRFHGNYEGGLIQHSLNLYNLFNEEIEKLGLQDKIPKESIIICAILHDVCKAGAYIQNNGKYVFNTHLKGKGHSIFALERISNYIELTKQEIEIIRYHMGYYGTKEFANWSGEYSIKELCDANNINNLTKLFHWCDDKASCYLDIKK